MNGFFIIDKPQGCTSFDVIRKLRKKLQIKKMGHLGTLDPMATGVLVVAVNKATKIIEYLMGEDKEYEAELTLGAVSDTYDADGKVESTSFDNKKDPIDIETIHSLIEKHFSGEITQIPPKYSALKIQGKRACDLMREGKDVQIKERKVTIHSFEVLEYAYPKLRVRIACSTGTYIRSIAHDLGEIIGCGAYLTALRRTKVGIFLISDSVSLEEVSLNQMLPMNFVNSIFEVYELSDDEFSRIQNGRSIEFKGSFSSHVIVLSYHQECVAMAHFDKVKEIIKPKKLLL